jgi:hypothetical protein
MVMLDDVLEEIAVIAQVLKDHKKGMRQKCYTILDHTNART